MSKWTGPIYDTMMAAYMLQPDLYKGLNEVSSLYFDIPRWKHKSADDPVWYNLTDCQREFLLYEMTREMLKDDGMLELFEGTIMPAMQVLIAMSARGLRVHTQRRDAWLVELAAEQEKQMEQWQKDVGNVNPASPMQVRKALYSQLKLPIKFNKDNNETAERAALWELYYELDPSDHRRPIIHNLISIRITGKLISSYARRPVGDDGRVHPYYLPVTKDSDREDFGKGAAGTGRIQARDPNIQQLPQSARRIIIPSSDKRLLVAGDYKQLELRLAAAQSRDEELLSTLASEDPFAVIMQQLGCDRTRAKNVAYGTIYGGGARAITKALRNRGIILKEKDAKELQNEFARRYSKLWLWRQMIVEKVRSQYYLVDAFGRRRYFYGGSKDAPAAIDFMCQGPAAGIVWANLLACDIACESEGGSQLATIHDEGLFEFDRDTAGDGMRKIKEIMERPFDNVVPGFSCPVSLSVGASWGEMVKMTEGMDWPDAV